MSHRILLLDCSTEVAQQLQKENFDVVIGSIGFSNGLRKLPCPAYEADIIVYNPTKIREVEREFPPTREKTKGLIRESEIKGSDAGLFFKPLPEHLSSGGILLVFANHLGTTLRDLQSIYNWIPSMPDLEVTSDSKLIIASIDSQPGSAPYQPILDETQILKPIRLRLEFNAEQMLKRESLITNLLRKDLGCFFKLGQGLLIVLPTFLSNDEIILDFMRRVVPQLVSVVNPKSIVDQYRSPIELQISNQISELKHKLRDLEASLKSLAMDSNAGERVRIKCIKDDRVASSLVNYFERAIQEPNYALFHLYKIVETIEDSAGGEAKAHQKYKCKTECKLIGRVANASYGDVRHAPKSADLVKQWSATEIDDCFKAAKTIIYSYFDSLFRLDET